MKLSGNHLERPAKVARPVTQLFANMLSCPVSLSFKLNLIKCAQVGPARVTFCIATVLKHFRKAIQKFTASLTLGPRWVSPRSLTFA